MNDKEKSMDNRTYLTVRDVVRELQEVASRCGDDIPVVFPSLADDEYEQVSVPIVMHARREPKPDDWGMFRIDPIGEVVVGLS